MKAKLHMKSGKTLILHCVKDFRLKYNSDGITHIHVEYKSVLLRRLFPCVLLESVSLDQIEAIERV